MGNTGKYAPRYSNITDEKLVETAKESRSISDFCKRLGYKTTASYYRLLKPRLDKLGVQIKLKPKHKHSDQAVIEAAEGANSVTEVMRRLGMKPHGFNHQRFKQRLIRLGVDVTAMLGARWSKGKKFGPKRPIEDYLVINSGCSITSSDFRKRLIKEGLKQNKCEICGQEAEWNGKPLSMHLDHISGDRTDNRIENLRVLCPNCHTQTPTYGKIKTTRP